MNALNKHKESLLNIALLMTVIVVTIARQPELLTEPRFWAEEGSDYFSYAHTHSWFVNLLSPKFGYNTLYHSIATSLATTVPLEIAPLVTTYMAFAVQLLVAALIVWGNFTVLNSYWKKASVLLLIPLICYPRNWLNTVGVQYWLCIVSFLILIESPSEEVRFKEYVKAGILTLTGLTGVTSCFMTPVFFLKALKTRSKQFILYTAIMGLCCAVQLSIFFHAFLNKDNGVGMRFVYNNPFHLLSKVLIFQFAEPILGRYVFQLPAVENLGETINEGIIRLFGSSIFETGLQVMAETGGAVILLILCYLFYRKRKDLDNVTIGLAFLLVFVFSTLLSVNLSAGPRYTFAPNAMLIVFFAGLVDYKGVARAIAMGLLVFSIAIHAFEYRPSMTDFAYSDSWPRWRDEVAIWRMDNNYRLKIWPPPWEMNLQKITR